MIKTVLQWMGGVFLIQWLAVAGVVAWSVVATQRFGVKADVRDVEFALHQGGIALSQSYSVIYSQRTPATFNGEHTDYYCVQLARFDVNEMVLKQWRAGPEPDPLIGHAVEEAAAIGKSPRCFSAKALPNTESVLALIRHVRLSGRQFIGGATILLFDPVSQRLLYASYQN